jgi:hypothetical protein
MKVQPRSELTLPFNNFLAFEVKKVLPLADTIRNVLVCAL